MRLPNVEQAVVVPRKLTDYLLSLDHPRGRAKAAWFEGLGFDLDAWRVVADALLAHAQHHAVILRQETRFGIWYTLEGEFVARRNSVAPLRTVWFIETDSRLPRFVTAYPPSVKAP